MQSGKHIKRHSSILVNTRKLWASDQQKANLELYDYALIDKLLERNM